MEHVKLKVSEILMGKILEKDLKDNQIICPSCNGLGITSYKINVYEDNDVTRKCLGSNTYFSICPDCYYGVVNVCKYCGQILFKDSLKCECKQQKEEDKRKYDEKVKEILAKAVKVTKDEIVNHYITDFKGYEYYSNIDEFIDEMYLKYQAEHDKYDNFDDFYKEVIPKQLWLCKVEKINLDAYNIISDACENLHEDAFDTISNKDIKELQNYLDKWCNKQNNTTTLYPDYTHYIDVQKEWFLQ